MKKRTGMRKMLLVMIGCGVVLTGCTKSHIVAPSMMVEPETDTKEGIQIDWFQVGQDLDETFLDPDDYPMAAGEEINMTVDPENHYVQLTVMVKEDTEPQDIADYATAVVKGMNDAVAMQDFNYEVSSDTSYGGFFKEYTVQIMAFPEGTYFSEGSCLLDVTIPAGEYVEIKALEE